MHVWEESGHGTKCPKCGSLDSIILKEEGPRNYSRVYALAKNLGLDEDALHDVVQRFSPTGDRSLRALPNPALAEMTRHLLGQVRAQDRTVEREERRKRMARKIIAKLCELGYVTGGKPDYPRINEWVREIGTNNPRKVVLWGLTYEEMQKVLNQVTARHQKTLVQ